MSAPENQGRGCVVVGLDEHGQPTRTLTTAADEATYRNTELAIVTVLRPHHDPGLNILGQQRDHHQAQATTLQSLHQAAATLHHTHPHLTVTTYCLTEAEVGPNREPLLWAQLLVLGTQDRYGRQALVLGSLSWLLLNNSRCPVLVVPDTRPTPLTNHPPLILVGVSQHPADTTVVNAAYTTATTRGADVLLLHAYTPHLNETPDQARHRAQTVLDPHLTHAPTGLTVTTALTQDNPADALLRQATDATLLVIGGRTGALSGLVRDSVSHTILETVPCPVLAIPRHLATNPPGPLTGLTLDPTQTTT